MAIPRGGFNSIPARIGPAMPGGARFAPGPIARVAPQLGSFKKGGKVKKTGSYKLHKGERVLTKKQAKRKSDTKAYVYGR